MTAYRMRFALPLILPPRLKKPQVRRGQRPRRRYHHQIRARKKHTSAREKMNPDIVNITVERCRQPVPVVMAIANAQFGADQRPVSVILGGARVAAEVWREECCLFEKDEPIDLTPEEDAAAIAKALVQLDARHERGEVRDEA